MREKRYQILQRMNSGYELYREVTTKAEAQSQLNALDFSGIPNLFIREYIIEIPNKTIVKDFKISFAPIQFSL